MKNVFFSFLIVWLPVVLAAQTSSSPDILLRTTSAINLIGADDDAFLAFGLGTEARLGNAFSLGGDLTFGRNEFSTYTFVQPHLRWYPKEVFRGFFMEVGSTFGRLNARDNLPFVGPPFDTDRGPAVSFFTLDIGLGFATLVKGRWSIGMSMGVALPLTDFDLEASLNSDFSVGYAF